MNAALPALSDKLPKKWALDRLAITLALFKDYITIQKGAFHFDSSKLAERLMEDLLSLLGPWGKFETLDHQYANHPAIDLLSMDRKIGVQVTSSSSLTKVKETIEKFRRLDSPPRELFVLMICGRQKSYSKASIDKSLGTSKVKFDSDKNILTLPDIYKFAEGKSSAQIENAVQRLEEQLSARALQLLQRFNASADRVLQVLTSHGASPALIVELLGLDSSADTAEILSAHTLQPLLTPRAYEAISAAFNIPVDWLSGKDDRLADQYGSSEWRGEGSVAGLIARLLTLHKSVHFNIVLPLEPGGEGQDANTPVLVFYDAAGKHGRVYGHLGIQPWNVDHHRKAALYLGTVARHLSLKEGLGVGVSWWQWPRERIMATALDTLLVDAVQQEPRSRLDETDVIEFKKGEWRFAIDRRFDGDFNKSFAPTVREHVVTGLERARRKGWAEELIAEAMTKFELQPPKKRAARVFGSEAFAIAQECGKKVSFVDERGEVFRVSVEDAWALMNQGPAVDGQGRFVKMVFIDVRAA